MAELKVLENVIQTVDSNTKRPEEFLSVQDQVALNLKDSIKCLYDFTKEQSQRNTNALPELVTEGFDEEQIWQQLELQNEGELVHFLTNVSKVLAGNKKLTIPITLTKPAVASDINENPPEEPQQGSDDNISDDSKDTEIKSNLKKRKRSSKTSKKKPSIVDDKFFKLQELDEYLTNEEKRENQKSQDTEESDDESVDLFNDFSENENENEDSENARLIKYAGFFDSPESEEEYDGDSKDDAHLNDHQSDEKGSLQDSDEESMNDGKHNQGRKSSNKRVKFNLTNDSDETDSIENKANQKDEDNKIKSSLELRQARLQERINYMEEEAISEKPWQLKGEVGASNRPRNSLLEEYVEFDITTRPAPIITEQTTQKLEDIILRRIKDKAWDDVEKKFKPVETPLEYKKKLILNQEKSKESLSQIYENEYLKQKKALQPDNEEPEEEEPPLYAEIREEMQSLFAKLDALSNFHFTPRQGKPELKIISNVPAIAMEEVAPVATSDAALLAPEEVKSKSRGDVIGKSERTSTDMKRARRKKKIRQRAKQKAIEEKEKLSTLKPVNAKKYKKDKDAALIKRLSHNRNVITLNETSHKVAKSSTTFFNQLQDQVKSHIKTKTGAPLKKKDKNVLSAMKLKL